MKQIKKLIARGLYDPERDDPFELFVASTKIRWAYVWMGVAASWGAINLANPISRCADTTRTPPRSSVAHTACACCKTLKHLHPTFCAGPSRPWRVVV